MKHISISSPCSENFNSMIPNEQGAYCKHCEKNVIDFTNKPNEEIKRILLLNAGKELCGRLTKSQEEVLNAEFEAWSFKSTQSFQSAFLFTLIAVFGLGLFSCSEQKQEQEIVDFQQNIQAIVANIEAKETLVPVKLEVESKTTILPPELPVEFVGRILEDRPPLQEILLAQPNHELIKPLVPPNEMIFVPTEIIAGGVGSSYAYIEYLESTSTIDILPTQFSSVAFPNPTTDNSTLEIKLPSSGRYHIDLYDMNGSHLSEIHEGLIEKGTFQSEINLQDFPAGIYLVKIKSKEYTETVRISKL